MHFAFPCLVRLKDNFCYQLRQVIRAHTLRGSRTTEQRTVQLLRWQRAELKGLSEPLLDQ